MVMVMEPIWESDFHAYSYGFRPSRSVHHAIHTVKMQLSASDTIIVIKIMIMFAFKHIYVNITYELNEFSNYNFLNR